jgi:voltage-gated potassium channel
VASLTTGLSPFFTKLNYTIWGLFVAQFVIELVIAPGKLRYLRRHWITAIALVAPAFRLLSAFRLARAFTVMRGARLVRVIGGANRGMRALGRVMDRRGVGYVMLLTLIVWIAGGAGIFAFERAAPDTRFDGFATAFWWTAMTLTTMGADFFPTTPEGRVLSLALAVYGFAIFGYLTATVASYFVARDADEDVGELAGAKQMDEMRRELVLIGRKLDGLRAPAGGGPTG